jgi:predicted AAA+ superfamily ATPase
MSDSIGFLAQPAISGGLERTLRRMNPWWENLPPQVLPPHRRHLVSQIQRRLSARLAPIIIVRGARQIGKTTSQLHVLTDLLDSGTPGTRILRVQFDELGDLDELGKDPVLRLADWFERSILKKTLNEAARSGENTYLFFDEVQNLPGWAPQLKSLVDSSTTQVVVTGSSALRIELGRDSLAGRISTIEAGVLSLTEIGALRGIDLGEPFLPDNGLAVLADISFWQELIEHGRRRGAQRDQAFHEFSDRGGYPLGHAHADVPWEQVADQLNETVIRRVIQHDLRVGERGRRRDAVLLEEIFRLVCRYAGQAPAIHTMADEARRVFGANLGDQRVRQYVRFLGDALLVRAVEPLEIRLKKKRGSPKLCLVDHALRASWLQERVPLVPEQLRSHPSLGTLAGHLAESTVGALLSTVQGLDVAHIPASKDGSEIDFVITIGVHRIPIEVKYQATIDPVRDVTALRSFVAKSVNHSPFALLVTQSDSPLDLGPSILSIPMSSLMLLR